MPDLASILERESETVEVPDDFERLVRRRDRKRRNRRIGTAILALVVAAFAIGGLIRAFRGVERHPPAQTPPIGLAFPCPRGSTPDEPGPVDQARPPVATLQDGSMVFDRGSGRMVLTSGRPGRHAVWTFDVCTNTWHRMPPTQVRPDSLPLLAYDVDADLLVAIGGWSAWTYDLDHNVWTPKGAAPIDWGAQPVYDPAAGLFFVRDSARSEMWTYEVDTDTWRMVDQGPLVPPARTTNGHQSTWAEQLLAYDASADRIVLYLGDYCGGCRGHRTFEFDPRSHTWSEQRTDTPDLNLGFIVSGNEIAYDEANERTVIFGDGTVAVYDATTDEWRIAYDSGGGNGRFNRLYAPIAYDPVNERIVVYGGSVRTRDKGFPWEKRDDVWAFDVATGEWIQLLAPSGTSGGKTG